MTFSEAVQDGFSKYVQFSGRSSRSAYWYWYLFQILVYVAASIVDMILGIYPVLAVVASLAILLPSLGITFRRLHDTGRSGWWLLIWILPIIGFIVILVFMLTGSDGPNKYGAGPDTDAASAPAAPAAPEAPAPPADGPQV